MTPYVGNTDDTSVAGSGRTPKSIMMNGGAKAANGDVPKTTNVGLKNEDTSPAESVQSVQSQPTTNGFGNKTGKPAILKRVSFGSSKGSMVETLVYDNPEDVPDVPAIAADLINGEEEPLKPPSKVRVTFYESQKPHYVTTPESSDVPFDFDTFTTPAMSSPNGKPAATTYDRQQSTDSGIDNPFRPGGELSREAETIVSLIKEGKPITPVKTEPDTTLDGFPVVDHRDGGSPAVTEEAVTPTKVANSLQGSKTGINGSASVNASPKEPGVVEVQHGIVVPPSDASQVEQVVIKKKPKCKCCVIQ